MDVFTWTDKRVQTLNYSVKKTDHAHNNTPLDASCRQTHNQLTIAKHKKPAKSPLVWVGKNSQCVLNWFTESLPAWPVVKYNNKGIDAAGAPLYGA